MQKRPSIASEFTGPPFSLNPTIRHNTARTEVNLPENDPENVRLTPKPYNTADFNEDEAVRRVVRAAGRTPLLVSGGSRIDAAPTLERYRSGSVFELQGLP